MKYNLLNVGQNAKTIKSDNSGNGYLTAILYLAPASTSGYNTCTSSTAGCRAACLFTAGRGALSSVEKARIRKTKLLFEDHKAFEYLLLEDLQKFVMFCETLGVKPAVRLNGTSDISWPKMMPSIFKEFPSIQHYNYTKKFHTLCESADNYHLTFSRSEYNDTQCEKCLKNNINVAVVFKDKLPETYFGYPVIDGDKTDLRFLDPTPCVVGLKAKGKAKKDKENFVI